MASVDTRLQTLRRAVAACRDTPGRSGRLVRLHDAEDLVVAGDMHGSVDNFRRLLALADLANHPRRHLVVQELIHGPFTYPDGSDRSHQLVDLFGALKAQYPQRVHYLVGNHELAQATGREVMKNDTSLNNLFRAGLETAYGSRGGEVYAAYELLFAALPFALYTAGRVLLCHSLPSGRALADFDPGALEAEPSRPADLEPGGPLYALVWGRDARPETADAFLARMDADRLVSGHIPCPQGFDRPSGRHLILDTQGSPAAVALLPADRPPTPEEWNDAVLLL